MKPDSKSVSLYERWIWIELIGFDNEKDDVGVGDYLNKVGFIPEAVSFLITSPDIINLHNGMNESRSFPGDYCSYFGHPYNSERDIQVWTNHQLKKLTEELQARGIKVFLSTFTSYLENMFSKEFASDHLELLEVFANGDTFPSILPLKRFADGSFYEDFFISKLSEVMVDYNFDGFHAADGWGPPRLPLSHGDYSDDMVGQFVEWKGIEVSDDSLRKCDGDNARLQERATWIRRNHWGDWIAFYSQRWGNFYHKVVKALHGDHRLIVVNSSWTRDPFEAIYRYGIDYAKIAGAGVDGFVTESAAGAADLEAGYGGRHYDYASTLMLIKAYIPNTKLVFLHGIKDITEQWDLLRHAPTILEKEVYSLANLYRQTSDGLQRCADGFVACLGDGIRNDEWKWLETKWDVAFAETPRKILGATLVWSDASLANEIGDFIENRGATTHRLLHKLAEHGAPIQSAVRIEDLESVSGSIILLNAHLLPQAELDKVMGYGNGPIIMIGKNMKGLPESVVHFSDPADDGLHCAVYGIGQDFTASIDKVDTASLPEDLTGILEPRTFLEELVMREVSKGFLNACAQVISEASGAVRVVEGGDTVRVLSMELEDGKIRLIIKNDSLVYTMPTLETGRQIESVAIVTEFPCARIQPDGSKFAIKVPGRGAVIVDIEGDVQ